MTRLAIKAIELTFFYDNNEVISSLSLEVPKGSHIGILGPNGSGKTTLLKLITKLLKPTSGKIELLGEALEKWDGIQLAKKVAVVPQRTTVYFPFTALEITLMGRAPHLGGLELESEKDIEIAREAMEKTATWELRNRSMEELSGGEAQRVILARALAQQPEILLMDEPTTHLDIKRQIAIMELITQLNRSVGLTVVTISHELNLITRYVDYLFLMKKGKIAREGEPRVALTKESIREVYEADVQVFNLNGKPVVIPIENGGQH